MKDKDLGKRLAYWANQLGTDKRYPWIGMGIIDDLEAAAKQLGAEPIAELVEEYDL